MTKGEAVNWLINIMADIGKIEHQDLWHYEQALSEIRELLEAQPEVLACGEGELSAQPEQQSFSCGQDNDAISRQAAIDAIMGQPPEPHYPSWYAEQIKQMPTIEERKTGRWVDAYRSKWDGTRYWFRQCDQCLYERGDCDTEKDTKYCPNCGAIMKEGEANDKT